MIACCGSRIKIFPKMEKLWNEILGLFDYSFIKSWHHVKVYIRYGRLKTIIVYLYAKQFSIGNRTKWNLNCSTLRFLPFKQLAPNLCCRQSLACRDENHQQTQTQLTYELLGPKPRTYPLAMWKTSLEHQPNHQLTDCCFSHEH